MKITLNLFITVIITSSIIFAGKAKLSDQGGSKSDINLSIESDEDIYGIQFDIRYNKAQITLSKEGILSKIQDIKIYSRFNENGIVRVLMFGKPGKKIFDVNTNNITDIIDVQFTSENQFKGTSIVELFNFTLAGRAGIEIDLITHSTYMFKISFKAP